MAQAARLLGLRRTTLVEKLRKYSLGWQRRGGVGILTLRRRQCSASREPRHRFEGGTQIAPVLVKYDEVDRGNDSFRRTLHEPVACAEVSTRLMELARRVARSECTVLIAGESGTGKEVLARYIHRHSLRAAQPFVAVNCAAIPENMLEAMLFGWERGAFTGAQAAHAGKFEQAQGGTPAAG